MERDELAKRWLLNQRARRQDQSRWLDLDAHDDVAALMVLSVEPEAGWALIMTLLRLTDDPKDIADIGIGPLEDLLRSHASALVEKVERTARSDPKFGRALAGLNKHEPITSMLRRLDIGN